MLLEATVQSSDSGYGTSPALWLSQGTPDVSRLVHNQDNDDDDARTVYTEAADLSDMRTESYVTIFAEDLYGRTKPEELNDEMVDKIISSLPELLKSLALQLGYEAQSQTYRDVMEFDMEPTLKLEPRPTEVMNRWLASTDETEFEELHEEIPQSNPVEGVPDVNMPGLEVYRRLLFEDPSYRWLVHRLRREMTLSRPNPDAMQGIREAILGVIPQKNEISRRKPSDGIKVTYDLDWDIQGFFRGQDYDIPNEAALANAITLTGSYTDAQARSCRHYLQQTWPSTGQHTLELFKEMLRGKERRKTMSYSSVTVIASGFPEFVVEIGEQLAWLGAALRSSPIDTGVIHYTPYATVRYSSGDGVPMIRCLIKYKIKTCDVRSPNTNGQCWRNLFANPVIAKGYPILRRSETDSGLEMPLDMLVALARAQSIDTFKSQIFIKGFSTMLVPTKRSDDLVIWHLLYKENPHERISYLDCSIECEKVTILCLEQSRHVLGWCSDAISVVGTKRAICSIDKSRLPSTHSGCVLEKAEVSGGQFVTGTAAFTLGNREKPVHISRTGYLNKMQWISSKHMVLWDEGEKRGWLVNGASALLHILRASLEHSKRKFQSAWLLDPSELGDLSNTAQGDSALHLLIDTRNRDLELCIDKSEVYDEETPWTNKKQDRIEHIYSILEKLIDHQTDAERRSGLRINPRPRRQLEGWDFKDLATDGDPFFPRVATLQSVGKGWVDFTRAIHAVTLFGRGFGELIQPRSTTCPRWSALPSEKYYLAACISDLQEIMENHGDADCNPRQLCDNVIWHMKHTTFDSCPCIGDKTRKHHDPVQVLFPLKFMRDLKTKPHIELKAQGAVIFGHNMNLHWHWGDVGDPVKGDPPPELRSTRDTFNDSGLGSSLSPSAGRSASDPNSAVSPASTSPPSSQSPPSPPTHVKDKARSSFKRRVQDRAWHVSKRRKS
ncbi:hypothetical protein F4677DRAFT_463389 [Hypoxylon crocopeplum]|nr:hypothetical protein F4677DRAFT_463389 [Hypoxylon crocopeplum]